MEATAAPTFRPEVMMAKVSAFVEERPQCTRRSIEDTLPGKTAFKRVALGLLVDEGFISRSGGPRLWRFQSVRPFREQPPAGESAAREIMYIREVSELLRIPLATLYDWRYKGTGPKSAKLGGRVAYRRADVDAWVAANLT